MSRAYFAVVLSQAMQISGDPTPTKPTTSCTEESPLVQELMAQAREKYVTQTELVPKIELLADTQKTMNFDERFDAALKKSNDLLSEAEAQLAAPCVAPTELTQEEEAELKREEDWNGLYKQADSFNDAWLRRNDQLLGDVTKLIDECDMERVTLPPDLCVAVPPPTPTLEQMDVPAPIASWIRASKRHLTQQPPNPSPAVDALRQIHSRSLSDQDFKSKSKAKSRIVAGKIAQLCSSGVEQRALTFYRLA